MPSLPIQGVNKTIMLCFQVDLEDKLDPVEPEIASFDPDPYQKEPVTLPVLKKVVHGEAIVEVAVKKKVRTVQNNPERLLLKRRYSLL